MGKHTPLKTYPANPATGVEGVKNPVPDGGNPCRVGYPAPTRQPPAKPGTPFLSGGVGYLSGDSPDKGFCDKEGCKPLLEGDLSGLSGRFSGECVDPLLAGYCRVPAG